MNASRALFSVPTEAFGWAEGCAFSRDGRLLAVAEFIGQRVALLSDGQIVGHVSGLSAPHAVAFSKDDAVLAIANRGNATVTLHARTGPAAYADRPSKILHRPDWIGTTDVDFDPSGVRPVVVNHSSSLTPGGSVTCFATDGSIAWVLSGNECGFSIPDGFTFSHDGSLLAVANNTSHEVNLYAKHGDGYRATPIARLGGLRHPHSLVFADGDTALIVTNSGGPNISVFRCQGGSWSSRPVTEWPACDYKTFLAAHYEAFIASGKTLTCEGGAKGLALHGRRLAWSGPSCGVHVVAYPVL